MKKILIIAFMALSLNAVAQLTPEQKKDPMRPKYMVQVGTEGEFTSKEPDGLNYTMRYYLKVKGQKVLVGVRFWLYGSNSYRYYWIPKYCKCSQEYIKVDE